jgi:hypothetical protein
VSNALCLKDKMNPKEELIKGVRELEAILQPYGFKFVLEAEGLSSGGRSASGAFVSGNKRLELHFRYSLGLVSYQIANIKIDHSDYIKALGGKGSYPGFSDKPIDAFRHLADDLKKYGELFLQGDKTKFEELKKILSANPPTKRLQGLIINKNITRLIQPTQKSARLIISDGAKINMMSLPTITTKTMGSDT